MSSILLIGLGNLGLLIAKQLDEMNQEIMAVDKDEDRVNAAMPYVTNAEIGDATNPLFLHTLGVGNYDICLVTIGNNFQNSLETTSLLKEMGAKHVVSCAEREVQAKFLLRNGADEIIHPQKQIARWVAMRYSGSHILDYIELDDTYAIVEVAIPREWVGQTIRDLHLRKRYDLNILMIKRGKERIISFSPDMVVEADMTIMVLGKESVVEKLFLK